MGDDWKLIIEVVAAISGVLSAISLWIASRAVEVHDAIDKRVRMLETGTLTRDELRDSLHDLMIQINRSEDRFDGRLEEMKKSMEEILKKLDRHLEIHNRNIINS